MDFLQAARGISKPMASLRHAIHREPEIGLAVPKTQAKVLGFLKGLGLEISTGERLNSITAVLRGKAPDPGNGGKAVVLLRADMDALPVLEETDIPFASQFPGIMHACGHDLHTAMLAGAARMLAGVPEQLPGDIVFMFQPGEEGYDGAQLMIDEGVLEAAGRRADAAFGLHVMAGAPSSGPRHGFSTKPGGLMSAADGLFVDIIGSGGHGSSPHTAADPIAVMATMIEQLQVLVARELDAFDPAVLSVGVANAGTLRNIIPHTAHFEATVRTFSRQQQEQLRERVHRLLFGIAQARGVDVDIRYVEEFPATVNHDMEVDFAAHAIAGLFGPERFQMLQRPVGASEDFSRILHHVPGAFVFLNAQEGKSTAFNHSPFAQFSDDVLVDGAAFYAHMAISKLQELSSTNSAVMAQQS